MEHLLLTGTMAGSLLLLGLLGLLHGLLYAAFNAFELTRAKPNIMAFELIAGERPALDLDHALLVLTTRLALVGRRLRDLPLLPRHLRLLHRQRGPVGHGEPVDADAASGWQGSVRRDPPMCA
jgi:hypothetical protein